MLLEGKDRRVLASPTEGQPRDLKGRSERGTPTERGAQSVYPAIKLSRRRSILIPSFFTPGIASSFATLIFVHGDPNSTRTICAICSARASSRLKCFCD